jgi:general secretion pathway protein D
MLGKLFRTTSTGNDKTNLFVFITPRVIKNSDEAQAILDGKKEQVQEITGGKINMYENTVNIHGRDQKK